MKLILKFSNFLGDERCDLPFGAYAHIQKLRGKFRWSTHGALEHYSDQNSYKTSDEAKLALCQYLEKELMKFIEWE